MNPLQYMNKIFCTLLFFSAGNKSYSQREIHPLEPMFTYDYALKYYGNIMAHTTYIANDWWWCIENFKAPIGVKEIKVFEDFPYYSLFRGHNLIKGNGKIIYTFNSTTGFLDESRKLDKRNRIVSRSNYKYSFGKTRTEIKVITNQYERDVYSDITYIYENKTDNLVKVIYNYTSSSGFVEYFYTSYKPHLQIINSIKVNNNQIESDNILSLAQDTINYIDIKNKRFFFNQDYSVLQGTNGILKRHNLKEEKFINFNSRIISSTPFLYSTTTLQRTSNKVTGTLSFGENFIFYDNVNSVLSHFPTERRGLMLFDENGQLIERHFYEFGYRSNDARLSDRGSDKDEGIDRWHFSSKDWDYRILLKENSKKWNLNYFGEREREQEFDENSAMIYRKTDSTHFLKKKNTIYYRDYAVLIYKYE